MTDLSIEVGRHYLTDKNDITTIERILAKLPEHPTYYRADNGGVYDVTGKPLCLAINGNYLTDPLVREATTSEKQEWDRTIYESKIRESLDHIRSLTNAAKSQGIKLFPILHNGFWIEEKVSCEHS